MPDVRLTEAQIVALLQQGGATKLPDGYRSPIPYHVLKAAQRKLLKALKQGG